MATGRQSGFPAAVRYPSLQSSGSDLSIVPYVRAGENWTLPDEVVLSLAVRAQREGVLAGVFRSGSVATPAEFLRHMQSSENLPAFAFRGLDCVGVGWLNGCVENRALVHFLLVKGGRGEFGRLAGRAMLDYWRAFDAFSLFIGLIPADNKQAIRFAVDMGFISIGDMPLLLHGQTATILYLVG